MSNEIAECKSEDGEHDWWRHCDWCREYRCYECGQKNVPEKVLEEYYGISKGETK